jgi:tRNA(Ile)-lysidine synthase
MLANVQKLIEEYQMLKNGDKILVGVSGGPDSMALLHILRTLQQEYNIELYTAHVNHMFRGAEAEADAEFVQAICREWDIPCFVAHIDVPARMKSRGISAPVAGREARYHFFRQVAAITGAQKIAVGHTADDQAETILMRFLRGAGPEGLSGIPACRDGIIRPLLRVYREEIEEYCRDAAIDVRRDPSNEKPLYLRNRIRNQLMPFLEKEYNAGLRKNLTILGDILHEEDIYWSELVQHELRNSVKWRARNPLITIAAFKGLAVAVQRRLLRELLTAKMELDNVGFIHVEAIRQLILHKQVGSRVDVPGGYWAIKGYEYVTIEKEKERSSVTPIEPLAFSVPGLTHIPVLGLSIDVHFVFGRDSGTAIQWSALFDWDRLQKPLYVRTRRPGDRFFHAGIGHNKKLKEFLIDRKVPQRQRDLIPVMMQGDQILWIVGHYIDTRYIADERTNHKLRIDIREEKGHAK